MEPEIISNTRNVPIAVIVVTYNRYECLRRLCQSLIETQNWISGDSVIIVDNNSSDSTAVFVDKLCQDNALFKSIKLPQNDGGAAGFYEGMKSAYSLGFTWFWIMDDDVLPLPGAVDMLWQYADSPKAIQVSKLNADGTIFEYSGKISLKSLRRSYLPYKEVFADMPMVGTNVACFEGMFIHRDVVEKVGLPDRDFFICWDDIFYGMKVSEKFTNIYIKDICLKKQFDKGQFSGKNRKLLSSSVFSRYFHIRNFCWVIKRLYRNDKFRYSAVFTLLYEYCKSLILTVFFDFSFKNIKIMLLAGIHGITENKDGFRRLFFSDNS